MKQDLRLKNCYSRLPSYPVCPAISQAIFYGSGLLICQLAGPCSGLVSTLFVSSASPVRQLTHWRRTGPEAIPGKNRTNPGKRSVKREIF